MFRKQMEEKQLTKEQVRQIAKEEAVKVQKELGEKVDKLEESIQKNTEILQRLDRLLLGEFGDTDEALKAKATYAFNHAKKDEDMDFMGRGIRALKWFEDMDTPDKGSDESNLDILGKMIAGYNVRKWVSNFLGIVNVATFLGLVVAIIKFIQILSSLNV